MTDIVTPEKRSEMMKGIKGKNTLPEMTIRRGLHALGFRYKLHDKTMIGKPDMVFPKYNAVLLIHGCFWHRHNCHLFKWPQSRKEFWETKINGNVARDIGVLAQLQAEGWRVLTIWECALKGKSKLPPDILIKNVASWLNSKALDGQIEGGI